MEAAITIYLFAFSLLKNNNKKAKISKKEKRENLTLSGEVYQFIIATSEVSLFLFCFHVESAI